MRLAVALLLLTLPASLRAAEKAWSLASPDGRCAIAVSLDSAGGLHYTVTRDGKTVILESPLGLRREDQPFERALTLDKAGDVERRREAYELFTGPCSRVDHVLHRRVLTFRNADKALLELDLAASNEGVAFRYRFPETADGVRVMRAELTGFRLPAAARGWLQPYHAASEYTPAYEDFYFRVSPGDPPPHSRGQPLGWAFPTLFHVPDANAWALITESANDGAYAACHLAADSTAGLYRIAFPAANEGPRRYVNPAGSEPRSTLPWTLPWRVIVLGSSAGDIATATLITDLAPPSQIADTSWIRPGRASWAWWTYPDGPHTEDRFNEFTDLAARMGWEYTLFDAGWWGPGLPRLTDHARTQNIVPLAWRGAGDYYLPERRQRRLDEMAAAGVRGVKVDFWCSDRQESIAAMHNLFADAAQRRLLVNLHGCTLPRGWQRTWPNFMTAEAVLGTESYFYESRYTRQAPQLNAILPFTRNAVGPMDYTPIACSPKKFARTTTAAHELATSIVFTSGLIHFADGPAFFDTLPAEARQILRDAPARWDESRCLAAEPGELAIFARRSGGTWFIAGLNGSANPTPVTLDLTPFRDLSRRLLIAEGADPAMQVAATPVAAANQWTHQLPPRGGFILRLDP